MPETDFRIETYKIFGVMKKQEYEALSEEDKEMLNLLMSCTVINLAEGSKAHTFLWSTFPGNTVTGEALRDPENGFVFIPAAPEEV